MDHVACLLMGCSLLIVLITTIIQQTGLASWIKISVYIIISVSFVTVSILICWTGALLPCRDYIKSVAETTIGVENIKLFPAPFVLFSYFVLVCVIGGRGIYNELFRSEMDIGEKFTSDLNRNLISKLDFLVDSLGKGKKSLGKGKKR